MSHNEKKPPLNSNPDLAKTPPLSAECLKAPFRGFFTLKATYGQKTDQVKNLWADIVFMHRVWSVGTKEFSASYSSKLTSECFYLALKDSTEAFVDRLSK
jgi:hypothetical protein